MGRQKLTLTECQETAKLMGGLCLSHEYIGNNKKMLWQCEFGHQWSGKYEHIKNGHWCPVCVGRGKYTIDDCIIAAKIKGGKCLTKDYKLAKTKIKWQCNIGHIWMAPFDSIVKGKWCQKCYTHRLEDCVEHAASRGGKCLSTEYIANKLPLIWECDNGHIWESSLNDAVNKNTWCVRCNKELRIKKYYDECTNHATSKGGKCLSDEYIDMHTKMKWSCHKGHIWDAKFNDIKNCGHWCPSCGLVVSKAQIKIHKTISAYFPDLDIILNDTKIIKPMDLDIFIPSLNAGIEYDGEYWHHSDWAIGHGSLERMTIKDNKCKSLGIKLLRIREKDYKQDEQTVLSNTRNYIENIIMENSI